MCLEFFRAMNPLWCWFYHVLLRIQNLFYQEIYFIWEDQNIFFLFQFLQPERTRIQSEWNQAMMFVLHGRAGFFHNAGGFSRFGKKAPRPLCFSGGLPLVSVFGKWQIWRGFLLLWKKTKSQNGFQCSFDGELLQRQPRPHRFPSLDALCASQHQATTALPRVYEHARFTSIYLMYPLARCVLRYQENLKELIFWVLDKNLST